MGKKPDVTARRITVSEKRQNCSSSSVHQLFLNLSSISFNILRTSFFTDRKLTQIFLADSI